MYVNSVVAARPALRVGALQFGTLRAGALKDWRRGSQWVPGNSRAFLEIIWMARKFLCIPGHFRDFLRFPAISRMLVNVGALRLRVGESGDAGWCVAVAVW